MSDWHDRFWQKVAKAGERDCWLWTAYRSADGYGKFQLAGKARIASRLAWEIANGKPAPRGLVVRHACDNPPCVNPAHLLIGTHSDNSLDQVARGRHPEARATHCAQGHPFEGENLVLRKGQRACAECRRASGRETMRRFRARRRARG